MFKTKKRIKEIQRKLANPNLRAKGEKVKELKIELDLLNDKLTDMRVAEIEKAEKPADEFFNQIGNILKM